jgi:hypothetical protein
MNGRSGPEADRDRKRAYSDCCTMHIPAERAGTGLSLQVAPKSAVRDNTDVHTHRGDRRFGIIAALAEMPMKPSVAAN